MVVDNAIVVVDDHVDKLDKGMDPWQAAWMSAKDLTVPVVAATAAIILSYVPLPEFVTGTAGDFLRSLPITIAVALVTSMLVAILLLPVMNSWLIRKGLHREGDGRSMLDRLQGTFDRSLEAAFRHPWLTVGVGVLSIAAAIVLANYIPQQMFPKVDRNQFAVEVYLPSGRSLAQTDAVIRRVEEGLRADPRVVNITAFVGQSSPRFHTVYAPHMPARNFGQLLVNTTDAEATEAVLHDCRERLRGEFPDGWVRWKQLEFSVGFPIEVRFSGSDKLRLKRVAAELERRVREIPEIGWVHNDWEEPLQTIEVVPDADECARMGIPPAMLQMSLAMGSQGYPVATIWEGDYPVSVIVEDAPEDRPGMEGMRQQYVSSVLGGVAVPLEQVASLEPGWQEGAIVRRNGVRTLTVLMDVEPGALASVLVQDVDRILADMDLSGVRVGFGGERELTEEVVAPMTLSMVVSIGLIFLITLFQFKRFRPAVVVMMSMPLSLIGAFIGLILADYPFGVTSFVGIIGLMGIAVRNGIILVTYAEELRREQGMDAMAAAIAAGKRRMRPIYLTAMAAAVGVVPLILSRSTLWGPLGTVTCFGLLAGMVLTLFVLPVAYGLVMRGEHSRVSPQAKSAIAVGFLLALAAPSISSAQTANADSARGPFTLDQCRQLAIEHNAQIRQASLEIEAAQATRRAAFTKYFPQVSGSVAGMIAWKPMSEITTHGGNLPVYDGNPANLAGATQFAYMPGGAMAIGEDALVATLMAVQPVYAGGRIVNGNRLAGLGVEIAQEREHVARRDVLSQTEDKYWRLLALREKLRTLTAYEALLAELERQVSDAVEAGLLTRNDLLKVRLKRGEAGVDRQRLRNGLSLSARDLRHHIGLPAGDSLALADTLAPPIDPAFLDTSREGALARRPEMRLLDGAVRAERLQVSMARGESLPTVSVGLAGASARRRRHGRQHKHHGLRHREYPYIRPLGGSPHDGESPSAGRDRPEQA